MRQIRSVLRLHLEAGLSYREVARTLGLSRGVVGNLMSFARAAGVDCAVAQTLTDAELEARLYGAKGPRLSGQLIPDYAAIHQELKRPNVTLQLLWEEYAHNNSQAYRYTSFCVKYRAWAGRLALSMRQVHLAGERMFVDYAGQTICYADALTGEVRRAQIFVAVLGASNYTFACATRGQTSADWASGLIKALAFFGGVPRMIVPDQPRAIATKADRYEPVPQRLIDELSTYYNVAVLPARPGKPRDKPKAEKGVQVVQYWILARLRNCMFCSVAEINIAIAALLVDLNARPFKKLTGCRESAFKSLDAPALQPLPATPMTIARFKPARVNIDYHVELEHRYYSVPYRLVHAQVELCITDTTVEILFGLQRVAVHRLSTQRGGYSTLAEHMPAAHLAHRDWTPSKLIAWSEAIGPHTTHIVRWQMEHRQHPEQGYRSCLGLKSLGRRYTKARLEAACERAVAIGAPNYHSVKSILDAHLDAQPITNEPRQASLPLHENVRGADEYQ